MKTKLTSLLIAALVLLAGAARAEDKITVAVYDFSANVRALNRDVTALVTADLSADARFVMVERAQLEKALGEQAFGLTGEINSDAAAKVGQLTGAKVLVAGRAMRLNGQLILTANIIGTETSRVYTEKVQGKQGELAALSTTLSQKIADTIVLQFTNFMGAAAVRSQDKLIDGIVKKVKGKHLPTVSVTIRQNFPAARASRDTAQKELEMICQKTGFEVLDEKSDRRPDVVITGSATADGGTKGGNLFSWRATLQLQAQERKSGKILLIDQQQSNASDIARQTGALLAVEKAVDELAERLLPSLANKFPEP